MKNLILLILVSILLCNCYKKINLKTLQGTWWLSSGDGDFEISFKEDSIFIENGYSLPFSGTYFLKRDSIVMNINNTITKAKINYSKKDAMLTFGNSKYWKRYDSVNRTTTTKQIDLINIKSEKTIHLNKINNLDSFIKVIKDKNNQLKVILNDRTTDIDKIPSFLISNCGGTKSNYYPKVYLFIGKKVQLEDLKKNYTILHAVNHKLIRLITYYDFSNRTFHYYNSNIHIFREDISLAPPPPPSVEDFYRKEFIKIFNPKILEIKSAYDFDKIQHITPNSHYLISITIELSIVEYLKLTQKLNSIRKNKKTRIEIEFINF